MKVVVGIDGSKHSLAALEFASRLLDPQKDAIVLYYSVPTAPLESLRPQSMELYTRAREAFAEAVFRNAKEVLPPEFAQRCIEVHDKQKPQKGLLTTANAHAAELLVVGARGTGRLEKLLLGSVSHAVAHACELPTLIVRNPSQAQADHPLRLLLACANLEAGADLTALLGKLSWPSGSKAHVLHVIESLFAGEIPDWLVEQARSSEVELQAQAWVLQHEQDKRQAEDQMRAYARTLPKGLEPSDVVIAEGHPAQEILEHLEHEPIDLTVVGTRGLGRVMRLLLGSTSEHVLVHTPTSVLLVPQHVH